MISLYLLYHRGWQHQARLLPNRPTNRRYAYQSITKHQGEALCTRDGTPYRLRGSVGISRSLRPFYVLFPYWAHFRVPVSLFGSLLFVYSLIIRFHFSIYFEYKEPATSARCHVAEVSTTVSARLPITYIVYGSFNYFLQECFYRFASSFIPGAG